METSKFVYACCSIAFIIAGIFYFINLSKRVKRDKGKGLHDIYDASLDLKGYVGGIGLIIMGIVILVKEVILK